METVKTASVLWSARLRGNAVANADRYAWAAETRERAISEAAPWMGFSDDELWDLMFGATLPRSWMVWSNGYCPSCKAGVPMYTWVHDGQKLPWKVTCPHCGDVFPKNDFHAYYKTGLDEHGVFNPELADRSLLFNVEHPAPDDPLHMFGVDDGWGYVDGDKRWRFVASYLIRGQWKQLIVGGISKLAAAFVLTGNQAYAHKAGIMLDRVADLHPTFDFKTQAWVYEVQNANGYESTWHDACGEIRTLVYAYDQVYDGMRDDPTLVDFLSAKARQFGLGNSKACFADIQRNIDDRLLRDTLANRHKTESNVPHTDVTFAIIKTVLGWPGNREDVTDLLDKITQYATAVDGLVGEKGLLCYAATGPHVMGPLLAMYARIMPTFLEETLERHPRLLDGYRFYFDTWCLQRFYPNIGDSGHLGVSSGYHGISFWKGCGVFPSAFSFFFHLYELTGDPAYAQALYAANGSSVDGLPYDVFADDPKRVQQRVREIIDEAGSTVKLDCTDKKEFHLAVLRSGQGEDARAVWLDYDSNGDHCHLDCMNLGIYAKGLDLMADYGYPPVQYGGWETPQVNWYRGSASHCTVAVDGGARQWKTGKTALWATGEQFKAMRVAAIEPGEPNLFERTVVLVDISGQDAYVLDIFRVMGGADHAKFVHSTYGTLATEGLSLQPGEDYGHGTFMRGFMTDASPKLGWSADWKAEDRHKLIPPDSEVHLHYIDLTLGAQASTCEGWVSPKGFDTEEQAWIPRIMIRRSGEASLVSTFAGVLEPYEDVRSVVSARRLSLETPDGAAYPDTNVAIEIGLADGRRDVLIAADVENPSGLSPSLATAGVLVEKETDIELAGEMCLVRFAKSGEVERVALCKGKSVRIGDMELKSAGQEDFVEAIAEKGILRPI